MKCTYCGFTYDDEPICPICGTPAAPVEQPVPFTPQPAPTVQRTVQVNAPAPVPEKKRAPKKKKKPVPVKGGKGLRIATFCVLSVIAAALVSGVVIQALSMSAELKHYKKASEVMDSQKKYYDENAKYYGILDKLSGDNGKVEFDEPDGSDYIAPKSFSDGTVRKVGETYTFDYGTLTLKSVKPVSEMAADSTKQMAALTLTVTNTTDKKLSFIHPKLSVGDTEFDGENYLFSESGSNEFSLNSGESASFVFYYKLPKENQKLDCNIAVYSMGENGVSDGSEYEFSAAVLYQFETKDVK